MNDSVTQLYAEYLQHTGSEPAAAASLTLADVMQSKRDDADRAGGDSANWPLTVPETAKRLHLSSKTVYQMCRTGQLRSFRVGRSIRIAANEITRCASREIPTPITPSTVGHDYLA